MRVHHVKSCILHRAISSFLFAVLLPFSSTQALNPLPRNFDLNMSHWAIWTHSIGSVSQHLFNDFSIKVAKPTTYVCKVLWRVRDNTGKRGMDMKGKERNRKKRRKADFTKNSQNTTNTEIIHKDHLDPHHFKRLLVFCADVQCRDVDTVHREIQICHLYVHRVFVVKLPAFIHGKVHLSSMIPDVWISILFDGKPKAATGAPL